MHKPEWSEFLKLLHKEVVPALGCTEPIAVALAAAHAAKALGLPPEHIDVKVSGNLLKNGMGVGVPGTGSTGLSIAAAVGAIGGIPKRNLEVLAELTPEQAQAGHHMVEANNVVVSVAQNSPLLYAEVTVTAQGQNARSVLVHEHTNIVLVEHNGQTVYSRPVQDMSQGGLEEPWPLTTRGIYEFATQAPFEDIAFILESARLNEAIALEGLSKEYGLKVGRTIDENIRKHLMSDDVSTLAVKITAAASDARMAGVALPVMSNSGSGNQGLTCTLPVVAFAKHLESTEEQLARALIMSHLISIHMKHRLGRLSALCGATVAATAAGCGIVLLMGGGLEQLTCTIRNMVGNVAGMICDGAKTGCAMKVASAVGAGVQSAMLAMDGISIDRREGIVEDDIEQCIANLARLGCDGMAQADKVVLDIMVSKTP